MKVATRILGIGSPAGDDRAGWAAAEAVRASAWYRSRADSVEVACLDRPGLALLAAMQGATRVVLIDAFRSGAAPGTVRRLDLDRIAMQETGRVSSHGFGLAEALALGHALGVLPPRLTLFGVEAGEADGGEDLSAAVRAALPALVGRVQASVTGSDDWSG
ncbi:MAG TPA: hydrogenase maturation protease [Casimicrobiaceae bacterium]|nr:hydrogenase maturation protease [Casimicrobiaceae bacterium]